MSLSVAATLALSFFAQSVMAQQVPSTKPIHFISPYQGGGFLDALTRRMSAEISKNWNQPVIVENRPGANSIIAADLCAKSPPDGHVFCVLSNALQYLPAIQKRMPFDPTKDLVPVAGLVEYTSAFVVNANVRINSVNDLAKLARAKPGTLNFGSLGPATVDYMFMRWLNDQYAIDLTHIPYPGQAGVLLKAVSAGDTQLTRVALPNVVGTPALRQDQGTCSHWRGSVDAGAGRADL